MTGRPSRGSIDENRVKGRGVYGTYGERLSENERFWVESGVKRKVDS